MKNLLSENTSRRLLPVVAAAVAAAAALSTRAAVVTLTANDVNGAITSLNGAGKWNNSQAPASTNDYFTSQYFVRTPSPDTYGPNYTFGGNSLTLQQPASGNARSVIVKSGGDTFVINNLTNAYGGILENGGAGNVAATFTGNLWTIAANSAVVADQGWLNIGYPLAGSTGVILTNAGGNANGITYNNSNMLFRGIFYISTNNFGNGGGNTRIILNAADSQPGNPTSFTPNQIWIGAGCTLQDNVGLMFTNSNGGFLLNGSGTATINAAATTTVSEPITDSTNGVSSICSLTKAGGGTLVLSNANNNYTGGTIVSAGTLQMGVINAIPGGTVAGDVTVNGNLDLNSYNTTINGLNGAGTIDNTAAGAPTLTVGANGDSGSFTGTIQNSSGNLTFVKVGAGSETLSAITYSGNTVVAGGVLNLSTASSLPSTPGSLIVSNAILNIDASSGTALPASSVLISTNGTITLTLTPSASGISASGNLTFQDNATNNFTFGGTLTANPSAPVVNVSGGISAPGSNIVINITAIGLQPGTFTLIKYNTGTLAGIANFQVSPPPGVAATLVNNTGNRSIDLYISSIPNQLVWNGVSGTNWDLVTPNWMSNGVITVFRQYTNGSVVAGDSVLFDDTLTNDFVNPQPTNITLNSTYYAFPFVVNSTLPYSIAGAGGITGVTSLVKSNTGSLTLLTSNSFTGGVFINDSGSVIITNDSALGASSGAVTLNSGTLQINGGVTNSRAFSLPATSTIGVATNVTVSLGGGISGAGTLYKSDNGTLRLTARETFTGNLFLHGGFTVIDSGGSLTNATWHDVGQNGTDAATLTLKGTGSLLTTSDFNVGDLDSSSGTLNVQDSATLTANAFFVGSANASGSTASGTVNQNGGTITEISTAVGAFAIGGRTSASGVGVYNMNGGTLTANAGIRVGGTGIGTLNQNGGIINAMQGINIARIAGSFGTNNLNGGTLSTYNVGSSTGSNAVFNFNGGTLQANFSPPGATWFSTSVGTIQANILAGGAIIDSSNNNVTISVPLLAGSANGGLTKKGSGTLTLTGANTYTGPTTNNAGTLIINNAVTNAGGLMVNAGLVQFSSGTSFQGPTVANNGGTLALTEIGSTPVTISNLTLNGAASGNGAVLSLVPGTGYSPSVPILNCGTLTLNGTNSISVAAANVGTNALLKYYALAGSGNCTNLILPQGASGYISNSVANSTLYAVVTSTGPGLVWTGTNSASPNVWDIGITTNWLVNSTPTSYHQIISPGDAVKFNDIGSGTVTLNNSAAPASITISNNAKAYSFSGTGGLSGPVSLVKLGTGTAILNLTNDTYTGDTVISNGTLQIVNRGVGSSISPSGNLLIGPGGTLSLSAMTPNPTTQVGEFAGAGQISYTGGFNSVLSFGGGVGGTWSGTIRDAGGGGLSLTKTGAGTWVVSGSNYLNNADFFNAVSQFQLNGGTTIITNGGLVAIAATECWIAQGAGSTSTVVVANGTLAVSNDWLCVGRGDATANGTLIVNGGTVLKAGANNIVVGSTGATGTLVVNGGQVLNNSELLLGESPSSVANLYLNGGLLQAADIRENNNGGLPTVSSVAYFNGGTLQANTNSTDFIQVVSEVMSNGLVLDDNGYSVSVSSQPLQAGDAFNGGLIKKGSGAAYLDSASTYTGMTVVSNGVLAGVGSVAGNVVVGPAGNLGAGDADTIGTLTINSNLTIQGKATMRINRDGSPTCDSVGGIVNVTYGGTLVISNLSSTTLTTSDTFQLFNATGSKSGNFASIEGSLGAGLRYQFTPSSGVLSVVTGPPTNPPPVITANFSGNTLTLGWAGYLGYTLQAQTNSASVGISTNWVNVTGSDSATNVVITVSPTNPTVFYRLRYQ